MFSLRRVGAGVAHCPSSNLKLASGIAPVAQMLKLGLKVGVGTDGPASNNDLDMVEEMRLASFIGKVAAQNPTVLPARQTLEIATISGARAIHMGHLTGSLEPGKRADIAVRDMTGIHNQPHFHNHPDAVYSRIVYSSKSSDVAHVLCNGPVSYTHLDVYKRQPSARRPNRARTLAAPPSAVAIGRGR